MALGHLMLNVHHEIDINESQIAQSLLNQGLSNATRITKRQCGNPTNIISAEVDDRNTYEKVLNSGIFIGYSRVKVVPKYGIKQCFRCFGIGHLKYECKANSLLCMICSGQHHSDNCPTPTQYKCANCEGDHCSVSRKCIFSNAVHKQESPSSQFDEDKLIELINKIVNETLNKNLESIITKAIKRVMEDLKLHSLSQNKQLSEEFGIPRNSSTVSPIFNTKSSSDLNPSINQNSSSYHNNRQQENRASKP